MKIVPGNHVIYAFEPTMTPVLEVASGDVVKFDSNDCFYQQLQSEDDVFHEIDQNTLNPATGPIYVQGAEPGDLLKVEILDIAVADMGTAMVVPNSGLLGDQVTQPIVRRIPIRDGYAEMFGLKLPIDPMIGVIGVAPADADGSWATASPWKHGGNMDTTEIRKGNTLYLPIFQPGALFALGDCHALMGDGEICITGLEIPADVLVRLSLIKQKSVEWPLLENKDHVMVIGSGDDLEHAVKNSMSVLVKALAQAKGILWEEAYILASLAANARISQVVDPKMTARAEISKNIMTMEEFLDTL